MQFFSTITFMRFLTGFLACTCRCQFCRYDCYEVKISLLMIKQEHWMFLIIYPLQYPVYIETVIGSGSTSERRELEGMWNTLTVTWISFKWLDRMWLKNDLLCLPIFDPHRPHNRDDVAQTWMWRDFVSGKSQAQTVHNFGPCWRLSIVS